MEAGSSCVASSAGFVQVSTRNAQRNCLKGLWESVQQPELIAGSTAFCGGNSSRDLVLRSLPFLLENLILALHSPKTDISPVGCGKLSPHSFHPRTMSRGAVLTCDMAQHRSKAL